MVALPGRDPGLPRTAYLHRRSRTPLPSLRDRHHHQPNPRLRVPHRDARSRLRRLRRRPAVHLARPYGGGVPTCHGLFDPVGGGAFQSVSSPHTDIHRQALLPQEVRRRKNARSILCEAARRDGSRQFELRAALDGAGDGAARARLFVAAAARTRTRGHRGEPMRFFRIAWVILAIIILGLDAAGIPYAYEDYASLCTQGARVCAEDGPLTPEGVRELGELGISRSFYAAYQGVGVETTFTLICFAVAAVIFLRRSDERMALFTSFVLLLFGGAGAAGTMRALAEAHPVFWFPTTLLDYVSQVCFGIFFYLFPDGRFVPRWTRWLAAASVFYWVPATFFAGSFSEALFSVVFFIFLSSLVLVQVYRYRRVSTLEQRQQTKWVVFGFTVALVGFTAILLLASFVPPTLQNAGPVGTMVFGTLIYGSLLLIPLSIGLAILH